MSSIGEAVRIRRAQLEFTQEDLADKMAELGDANIRQSDISRIENGQVQLPRFERLHYLAVALDMSVADLLVEAGLATDEMLDPDVLADEHDAPAGWPVTEADRDLQRSDTLDRAFSQGVGNQEQFERNWARFERLREMYELARERFDHPDGGCAPEAN